MEGEIVEMTATYTSLILTTQVIRIYICMFNRDVVCIYIHTYVLHGYRRFSDTWNRIFYARSIVAGLETQNNRSMELEQLCL